MIFQVPRQRLYGAPEYLTLHLMANIIYDTLSRK